MMSIDHLFTKPWREVPTVWVDFECTGKDPGVDRAVQVGFARFEQQRFVDGFSFLINPGIPIPLESQAIHHITDDMVAKSPTVDAVFALPPVRDVLSGAQVAAYNASYDSCFVPAGTIARDWPWLDALSLVRLVDRFAKGKGRHRLSEACKRHGVELTQAHSAGADARAAGELFYKIAPSVVVPGKGSIADWTLGMLLCWQGIEERKEWYRFLSWKSQQPPLEAASG